MSGREKKAKIYISLMLCVSFCGCAGSAAQPAKTADITSVSEMSETFSKASRKTETSDSTENISTEVPTETSGNETLEETSDIPEKITELPDLDEGLLERLIYDWDKRNISYVEVPEDNELYASVNGLIYSKDMKKLLFCPRYYSYEKNIVIADGTEEIGAYAFNGCQKIESVVMPDSIREIGLSAFGWCKSLKSIRFSGDLRFIGNEAFQYCESLTEIMLPDSACESRWNGFNITWSSGTFHGCSALKTVRIPCNDVVSLHDGLLDTIEFDNTFYKCSSLESFVLSENADEMSVYNGALAKHGLDVIVRAAPKFGAKTFTVPSSTRYLGTYVFQDCTELKELIIEPFGDTSGEGARDIRISGSCTIEGCTGLEKIVFPEDITKISYIDKESFPNLTFYVKQGSAAEKYAAENDIPYEYY